MNAAQPDSEEINDPQLARLLSMCRNEEERERAKAQWRSRQAAAQAEREAEQRREEARREATLVNRRTRDEAAFMRLVRENYPFSDESFEADWPALRARLIADLILYGVAQDWERYQEQSRQDAPSQ